MSKDGSKDAALSAPTIDEATTAKTGPRETPGQSKDGTKDGKDAPRAKTPTPLSKKGVGVCRSPQPTRIEADPLTLARALSLYAAKRERHGDPFAGLVRQAARWIVAAASVEPDVDQHDTRDRCVCGRPIDQPATGRRRKWCSTKCKNDHR